MRGRSAAPPRTSGQLVERQIAGWQLVTAPEDREATGRGEAEAVRYSLLIQAGREVVAAGLSRRRRWQTWQWILSDDDGPFSFRACCHTEGVDIDDFRDLMLETVRRQWPDFHPRHLLD